MNKNSCRECSIRERCIDQSNTAAYIKNMIRNAFNSHTDTVSTWAQLQKNCLWVIEAEASKRREREESQLSLRLRRARQANEEPDQVPDEEATQRADKTRQDTVIIPLPEPTTPVPHPKPAPIIFSDPTQEETPTPQMFRPETDQPETPSKTVFKPQQRVAPRPSALWWLTINHSRRHISLPTFGKLLLGRFDPHSNSPVDIDLTYEDRNTLSISRRHARIVGLDGRHTIEDLDSSNGVFINSAEIAPYHPHRLQSGDHIALGSLEMFYDKIPPDFLDTFAGADQARRILFITHTGRKMIISPPNNILIGRSDPAINFAPSIDLSHDGEVAACVSRRHARITWSIYGPHLTDLGSSYGTRLNGEKLDRNQVVLLKPGDHISLGGCVLAYDVEM